jgi:predicted ArsR family transcriptional regulator
VSRTATESLGGAKRRLLERLKRVDDASAVELAAAFGLSAVAVRQHLDDLARAGLVSAETPTTHSRRGRPALRWRLTPLAASFFPDHHADLTVSLLAALRESVGEEGIGAVIDARTRSQLAAYRDALPDPATASVAERLEGLARLRTVEGYMAETTPLQDGDGYLLVEHHCPICEAATTCQALCRGELELFQAALGDDVAVERSQHLMSGDQRCAYRVTIRGRRK